MNIYEPTGRAREYSPLALNYFKGCDHGCLYCYVPNMLGRFNSKYEHSEVFNPTDFKKLEQSASKMRGCEKQILLSFTGDPYCNSENGETKKVLEILNFYGHKVAILTKQPDKAMKDIETFKKFGSRFKIGSTLTFDNEHDSKIWEKGASDPAKRITALEQLANEGIKTWASFEPVIIPNQSLNLLSQVVKFIDHVKIGKINNYKGIDKQIDWAKFIFESVRILRESNMNDRFYVKKDLLIHNTGVYLSGNETNEDFLNL
jgi:DNA repair photolyase